MESIFSHLGLGILVFASTNIDDILLLSVFFADRHLKTKCIVTGQFLGIGALVMASLLATWASLIFPERWIALLGLFPLILGVKSAIGLLKDSDNDGLESQMQHRERQAETRFHSQVLAVAGVTIANGGDNLGIYIPLFTSNKSSIPIYLVVFTVLTAVWCGLGYALINNRIIGDQIRKYGGVILPFVLIALGVHILHGFFQ